MISASWPMPESHIQKVEKKVSDFNSLQSNILKSKKLQIENLSSMPTVDKKTLLSILDSAIEMISKKSLQDVYQPNGPIPFPKDLDDKHFVQPSLFEGTKFDPNNKFDSTKFIDLYNSLGSDDPSHFGKVVTGMIKITKEELPPEILSGQFNFSAATYEEIAAIFGVPDKHLHSIQIDIDNEFPYSCRVTMKRYLPF